MYIYGGYDLNQILGDLIAYDFKNGGVWLTYNNEQNNFVALYNKSTSQKIEQNNQKELLSKLRPARLEQSSISLLVWLVCVENDSNLIGALSQSFLMQYIFVIHH